MAEPAPKLTDRDPVYTLTVTYAVHTSRTGVAALSALTTAIAHAASEQLADQQDVEIGAVRMLGHFGDPREHHPHPDP